MRTSPSANRLSAALWTDSFFDSRLHQQPGLIGHVQKKSGVAADIERGRSGQAPRGAIQTAPTRARMDDRGHPSARLEIIPRNRQAASLEFQRHFVRAGV